MKPSALNLLALRACRWPVTRLPGSPLEVALDVISGKPVTRRSFLALGGAALGASAAKLAVPGVGLGPFEMVGDEKRIAFLLGGRERWVIDTSLFGGEPQLRVNRGKQRTELELKNARFPGTNLPADLVSELRPSLLGWKMKIRLKAGAFKSEVPFERWLADEVHAISRVSLNGNICDLAEGRRLLLSSPAMAEFRPNWVLRVEGTGLAEVVGVGTRSLQSDSAEFSLLTSADPSLLANAEPRRSLVALNRGRHSWEMESALRSSPGGRMTAAGSLFDRISIEAGELRRGIVAESLDDASHVTFEPARHLLDHSGEPFQMPLHRPRYAVTWDADGEESALVAQFPEKPVWLHANGCAMQIGKGRGSEPFELVHRNGELANFQCAPSLLRTALPLSGAISEPTPAALDAKLRLILSAANGDEGVATSFVSLDPGQKAVMPGGKQGGQFGVANPKFQILRPQDLLSLGFQCTNLMYIAGANPTLNRIDPNAPAYISVIFQPQSIAEQAFFEAASSNVLPQLPDNDQGRSTEALPLPPAKAQLSGPSQLVFQLPAGTNQIPYNLQSLLSWWNFDLNVAPVAQPAPFLYLGGVLPVSTTGSAAGVRKIAPTAGSPSPAASLQSITLPPKVPSNTPQFIVNHPTVLENVVRQHPELLQSTPGLAQALVQIRQSVANPTPQASQAVSQIAQQLFTTIPNLGNLILQSLAIVPPDAFTTSIEAPYRLMISPSALGAWANATSAVQQNGWTELWHTRLGLKVQGAPPDETSPYSAYQRVARAIWSPDYASPPQNHYNASAPGSPDSQPFRTSLDHMDHYELVRLTSDFNTAGFTPEPVKVNRLMLSSLGAWLDAEGEWANAPSSLDVTGWKHRSTMGRDHYARVVYRGHLYPFGHAASLVKVTERKFQRRSTASDPITAYSRQRFYIVVRQHEKSYSFLGGLPNQGRDFPFRTIQITTNSSPDLDDPTIGASVVNPKVQLGQDVFWPCVGQQPFQFHVIAEDMEGQRCDFSIPMIFVSSKYAYGDSYQAQLGLALLSQAYNAESPSQPSRRWTNIAGVKVAYAQSSKPGDTSLTTTGISFGPPPGPPFTIVGSQAQDQAAFYPTLAQAQVNVPAIAQLLGPKVGGTTQVALEPTYVGSGFPGTTSIGHPNAPSLYLRLLSTVAMDFSGSGAGDKGGGLISPSLNIMGISRTLGTVGGDPAKLLNNQDPFTDLKQGNFNPQTIFAGMASAKIMGAISLADIVSNITGVDFSNPLDTNALKIKTTPVFPGGNPVAPPTAIDTTVVWTPDPRKLQNSSDGLFLSSNNGTQSSLTISAALHTDLTGAPSTTSVTGELDNFTLSFFNSLNVGFSSFVFKSQTGSKMQVTPTVANVTFMGAMSFVNTLESMLSQGGSDWGGLTIDVQPTGITVKDTVALPDIAVGVMSLQNLGFSAELDLPFTGDPATLTFMFCSKQKPFIMSYCAFAGGGFFAIAVSLQGIQSVEVSLWFGGSLAINLGVASGGVHIMAGIDLILATEQVNGKSLTYVSATAFIQIGGSLRVLGLITLSLEFDLSLTFFSYYAPMKANNVLVGQCTLTVQLDVACFSKSVDLTVERVITSGGGVSGLLEPLDWPQTAWGGGAEQVRTLPKPRANSLSSLNSPTFVQMMDEPTWETVYLAAFAA